MRHEITIICDDIRREIGNKISLMGLYDDAIVIKQAPARLSKLCVFQRWMESNLGREDTIRFQVSGTALVSPVYASCKPEPAHFDPRATKAQLILVFAPFDIVRPGYVEFVTFLKESDEPSYRYRLDVRIDTDIKA